MREDGSVQRWRLAIINQCAMYRSIDVIVRIDRWLPFINAYNHKLLGSMDLLASSAQNARAFAVKVRGERRFVNARCTWRYGG